MEGETEYKGKLKRMKKSVRDHYKRHFSINLIKNTFKSRNLISQ